MIEGDLKERILKVDWLVNCGQSMTPSYFAFDCKQIFDWSVVNQLCKDIEWSNFTLEQSNKLSDFVERKNSRDYEGWNDKAKSAKKFFDSELRVLVSEKVKIYSQGKEMLDSIEWDLVGFILENSYKKLKPPIFYENLFSIYESGHFPCGLFEEESRSSIIFI